MVLILCMLKLSLTDKTCTVADADAADDEAEATRSTKRSARNRPPRSGRPSTGTAGSGRPFVESLSWAARGHDLTAAVKEEEGLLNVGPQGEIDQPGDDYGYPVDNDGVYRVVSEPDVPMAAGSRKRQRLPAAAAAADDDDGDDGAGSGGGDDDDDDRGGNDDDDVEINSDDGNDAAWEAAEAAAPAAPHHGLLRPAPGGASGSGVPRREMQRNLPVAARQHGVQRRFFYDTINSPNGTSAAAAEKDNGSDGSLALTMISGGIANHLRTIDRARASPPTSNLRPADGSYLTTSTSEASPSEPRPPDGANLAVALAPRSPHDDGRTRASVPSARPPTMSFLSLLSQLSPEFNTTAPSERAPLADSMELSMGKARGPETEAARRWRMVSTLPPCFREYYRHVHS